MYDVVKAAKNVYGRATSGVGMGNSGITGRVRYALTPQRAYASTPSYPQNGGTYITQGGNGTFGYEKKADGGYDYYIDSNKVSLADYQAAGGQIPSDEPAVQSTVTSPISDAGTSGTGGTSGSGTIQSNKIVGPDGGIYDLATPAGAAAYKIAKDNWVNEQYTKYTGDFATDLRRSKEDNSTQRLTLARSKKNFYGDIAQGGTDEGSYARDIKSLGTNRDSAQQSVMGRFLNLGPNVYQSAEGENLKAVGNIYDEGVAQSNREKADIEANFGTADTQINRVAEDLAKQEIEQPKYFDNWRTQNLAQNTLDTENALGQISSAASKARATTPTFQEKTQNFLSDAVGKFQPYYTPNVYNNVVAPTLAKNNGVNLASGSNLYEDAKILAGAGSGDYSQEMIDNIYRKYGLLN